MKIIWTPEAQQDRAAIWDYIAAENLAAAARMDRLFSDCAAKLSDFPMLGHAGEVTGTRELTRTKVIVWSMKYPKMRCGYWF